MKILVSGSTGMVGTAVVEMLRQRGHTVCRLVRPETAKRLASGPASTDVRWDPVGGQLDAAAAEGAQAVVHLAGATIAGRWNEARKRLLRESRVDATRHLVAALSQFARPPRTFIGTSAVGYYGDRGDEELDESRPAGAGFLAELARDWEMESSRAANFGARVLTLRYGVIFDAHAGALPQILVPFRLGIGGRLGSGNQWMAWLTLTEAVHIIRYALENEALRGPCNAVAPNPVRNREFTAILGKVLRRPTIFPVPAFAVRLALGEMADALLLASQRAVPKKLQEAGYRFEHPELEPALRALLKRPA